MGSILSVNVAEPRQLERRGQLLTTGLWKQPVEGRVPLRAGGVEGDLVGDVKLHGGEAKAVRSSSRLARLV